MKNPNGYGTVYKLKGRRRNPWAVRVTVGKKVSKSGRIYPKYEFIGFYRTRSEGMAALADYNAQGAGTPAGKRITLGKVYEEWSSKTFPKKKIKYIETTKSQWETLSILEDLEIQKISLELLEEVFLESGKNTPTLSKMKTLINHLFRYAAKYEWISTEKARVISMMEIPDRNAKSNPHKRIPEDVIRQLWDRQDEDIARTILFLIYTGLRLGEFMDLVPEDVNLEDHYFHVPESKTPNGIRNVPIHDKIFPWVVEWMNNDHGYINPIRAVYEVNTIEAAYRKRFKAYLSEDLGVDYLPHDCRHTFVSKLKDLIDPPLPDSLIKSIVGHASGNVTDAVYTHYSPAVQLAAVNRIK